MKFDVIVIGGGAAGMMSAYSAATAGKSVLMIDKNDLLGRKLRITGKGRCNITNDCDNSEFLKNISTNSKFLYSAINQFSTADTKHFFLEQGVSLKTERGSRVFPVSDKAADVANAMAEACKDLGVKNNIDRVVDITTQDGVVTGVICKNGGAYESNSVIIATGGMSYPLTGSDGEGYKFAKKLGHTITEIKPSLVSIISKDECCADMQGLSLKNVGVSLYDNQKPKPLYRELGEMLFTHFGMSGPLILSASAHIKKLEPNRFTISIDLKPGLDETQLDTRILRDFKKYLNKDFVNSLDELLPKKIIPIIITRSGIPPFTKVNSITKEQRKKLCELIKSLVISVDDFSTIAESIVTSGGVDIHEINPKTMESKIVKGLYFAGEVIDVDGYTGGFNLQIAFSTGYVAGINC
ncbi:MAG: NAD(P)/FAD-dependent oxidoreductase [Oscillospiraceae bacterium]